MNSEQRRLAKTAGIALFLYRVGCDGVPAHRRHRIGGFWSFRESSKVGTTAPPLSAKLCF
ncbi:hypothetical protein [Nostoc sp.]|uniref:hypothetical protein n=1 Tax=Nostoc sp. TaxID=1180 RepID=UPI002FFC7FE8